MKKLAVFVEGYTELLFVERLIKELAGENNVAINTRQIRGGSSTARKILTLQATQGGTGQRFYVLILDCGSDEQVKTRILEEYDNLARDQYVEIIGMRDVRPGFTLSDIPKLERGLLTRVPMAQMPVTFVLSVMEIEAWFLAEYTHFSRIAGGVTCEEIHRNLGFDPRTDDLQLRVNPTLDLAACYVLAGDSYTKQTAKRTVDVLDIEEMYLRVRTRFRHLDLLSRRLEAFLQ